MRLASFDIFDTVLIRKCGNPENIFYLLANQLYPNDLDMREAFILWRRHAEHIAQYRFPKTDVTLAQIYSDENLISFPGYTPQQLMTSEINVEIENLIANPVLKNEICQKRQEGYTICFISDMYLDSKTLSSVLKQQGCLQDGEKVYVSCEWNARKSTGLLFDIVKNAINPTEWCHYGDNWNSDVKIPRKKGIKAYHVDTTFTEVESKCISIAHTFRFGYELSILTGFQRALRITQENNAYAEIAADFIAPTYVPYVYFILQQAQVHGLKRLYFLSRDSYILMKMAEVCSVLYPEIELRYLFLSRKSLLLPYMTEMTSEQYLAVQDHKTICGKQVNTLLASFETNRIELEENYGITFDYNKITNRQQEQDFLQKIFGNTSCFRPVLEERAFRHRELLYDYFKQEGLTDNVSYGMVDVGWLGTSRLMINSILKKLGFPMTKFFYLAVRNDVLPLKYGKYLAFNRPEQLSSDLTFVIEDYFSASPYPTTIGYISSNIIKPKFPNNCGFQETILTTINVSINQLILKWMLESNIRFQSSFDIWTSMSVATLTNLNSKVNLLAFKQEGLIRQLNVGNLMKLIILGGHITNYDRASLRLTIRYSIIDKMLWGIHLFTSRIRRFLAIKLKK